MHGACSERDLRTVVPCKASGQHVGVHVHMRMVQYRLYMLQSSH
jgi:hypothetical protein